MCGLGQYRLKKEFSHHQRPADDNASIPHKEGGWVTGWSMLHSYSWRRTSSCSQWVDFRIHCLDRQLSMCKKVKLFKFHILEATTGLQYPLLVHHTHMSTFMTASWVLPDDTKRKIASLLITGKKSFILEYANVRVSNSTCRYRFSNIITDLDHYESNLGFCSHWLAKLSIHLNPLIYYTCMFLHSCHNVNTVVVCLSSYVRILLFVLCRRTSNGNDCGLFAVAFAMAICLGQALEDLYLNVKLMRSHLSSCLAEKKRKAFPSRRINVKKREKSIETVPVYCKCRSTERGRMICCDTCSERYHDTCIDVPLERWTYPDSFGTCTACTL